MFIYLFVYLYIICSYLGTWLCEL